MESIILTEKNFSKLKELVKQYNEKKIIFYSNDDDLNRKVMEKLPIKVLLIPLDERKDFMKQRNSGFNEVLAKIAKKEGIKIGIDLNEIICSQNKERILSRLKQNINLCKRNKLFMEFFSIKEKRNLILLKSLGLVLGMPTWMTKNLELN